MVSARKGASSSGGPPRGKNALRSLPAVSWSGTWESLLGGRHPRPLEAGVLPRFLQTQRWFAGKARTLRGVRIGAAPILRCEPHPHGCALAIARVEFASGPSEHYFLPLALDTGRAAALRQNMEPESLLAHLEGAGGPAVLFDALSSPAVVRMLLGLMAQEQVVVSADQTIEGTATPALTELLTGGELPIERGPAASSNSILFVGRRLLFKGFRRLEPGLNPDVEIGEFLARQRSTARVPRTAGTLVTRTAHGPTALALLQERVENEGDGWTRALQLAGGFLGNVSGDPEPDARSPLELTSAEPPTAIHRLLAESRVSAGLLGKRTADLHLDLARSTENPDFAPEPLSPGDLSRLRDSVQTEAGHALQLLDARRSTLEPEQAEQAANVISKWRQAREHVLDGHTVPPSALKHRVHGDFHLGQVLWTGSDYVILDFEGEPMRPLVKRRAKHSPLKDVAGMLRSYHYAAVAGLGEHSTGTDNLRPWAEVWFRWTAAAFLRDYLLATDGSGLLPADQGLLQELLNAYLLEKAFYELAYELNNRPDWVGIPLRGLLQILR